MVGLSGMVLRCRAVPKESSARCQADFSRRQTSCHTTVEGATRLPEARWPIAPEPPELRLAEAESLGGRLATRDPERRIDLLCGFTLHVRHDMAVDVHGHTDVRVAQTLGDDFRVNPLSQQQRRVRVP